MKFDIGEVFDVLPVFRKNRLNYNEIVRYVVEQLVAQTTVVSMNVSHDGLKYLEIATTEDDDKSHYFHIDDGDNIGYTVSSGWQIGVPFPYYDPDRHRRRR